MSPKEKKEIEKYIPAKSIQLNMFDLLDSSHKDYSNSIELYDTMPKYNVGGIKREKGKLVDSLPILSRDFIHRKKQYKLDISPAAVHDKKTGKTIHYYPSQREELVEDALRKIATKGRAKEFEKDGEKKVGVTFSYYELQQELEKMGHGYSIAEVKLAIEILSKAVIEITSKDGAQISMTNNFFSAVGKETLELGGKERVVVIFHNLVSNAINTGNYRLFNYDKLMKMKMQVSRWLYRRISHIFTQATIDNPYHINLSTIVRDSGMKEYKTISERIRQVEKCLNELSKKEIGIISRWEKFPETEKNKILDIKYLLFMSEEFVSDAKKASALTNLRLGGDEPKIEFSIDDLRKEIEKPIYGLTKTIINTHLNNITDKEEYDKIANALEAVKGYIELKKSRNEKITNHGAITQKAIQQGWVPPKAENEEVKTDSKEDLQKIIETKKAEEKKAEIRKELKQDPSWKKIREKIQDSFDEQDWNKWLSGLEIFSIEENKIFLSAPDKFKRDWIVSEFLEKSFIENGKEKNLKTVIKEVCPNIDRVVIICISA